MKKIVSIILAIVMMFSFTVVAFAANDTVSLGEVKSVSIKNNGYKRFDFTPAKAGLYTVDVEMQNEGVVEVQVAVDNVVVGGETAINFYDAEEGLYNSSAEVYFCTEGASTVEITVTKCSFDFIEKATDDAKIKLSVNNADAKELQLGKTTTDGGDCWYTFTPSKSGYYNFCSNCGKSIDPEFCIYRANGDYESNSDNGKEYADGTYDLNFDWTVYLESGTIYAVNIYSFDEEYDLSNDKVTFEVSFNKNIKAEKIALDMLEEGETFRMAKGEEESFFITVVPTGAAATAKVAVSSSNESVLSVEYDEEIQEIYVTANKKGTAKIILTSDDGTTTEYPVKVDSLFVTAIRNFFENISLYFVILFMNLFGWMFGV